MSGDRFNALFNVSTTIIVAAFPLIIYKIISVKEKRLDDIDYR